MFCMPRLNRKSKYTVEAFQGALKAVSTKQLGVRKASEKFKVPYETLRRKYKILAEKKSHTSLDKFFK